MRGKKKVATSLEDRLRAVREATEQPGDVTTPTEGNDAAPPARAAPDTETETGIASEADAGTAADADEAASPFPAALPALVATVTSPLATRDDPAVPALQDRISEVRSPDQVADRDPVLWAASEGDTLLASGAVASAPERRTSDTLPRVRAAATHIGTATRRPPFGIPHLGAEPAYDEPVPDNAHTDASHTDASHTDAAHTDAASTDAGELEPQTEPVVAETPLPASELVAVVAELASAEPESATHDPQPTRGFGPEPDRPARPDETPARQPDERTRPRRLVRVGGLGRRRPIETDRPSAEQSTTVSPLADLQPEPADSATDRPSAEQSTTVPPLADHQPEPADSATTTVADETPWTTQPDRGGRFGRIGTTMIERGLITHEQLDAALEVQRTTGRRVGEILVGMDALSRFELARVLADHMGVPFVDLRAKPPDAILGALLPEEVARRYRSLVIDRWNNQLVIAMANPSDLFALDDLQMVMRQPIITAMAVEEDLLAAIDRVYRESDVETTLDAATTDYVSAQNDDVFGAAEVDEGPVVRLVNALLEQAIRDHASDLHVEPSSTRIAIRFRVDGVLHDSSEVPLALLRPLVSRLKILSNLDIAQNRVAQDGRFSVTVQGRPVDVRVVTVPTAAGESVILRLLDPTRDTLDLSSLGLNPAEEARFVPPFFASQGAAFIVGPTGSGKTSTVYTLLSEINTRSKSIVSVEDPVEYRLDGMKQIQANPRVGLTFANTLPSILRSDPDIVFIGEVRDAETARIAADASITGHLVLSTLHATKSAAAPMRLIEMGVEPYLVASALTLVAAQRLARKLCDLCAQPAPPTELDHLRELGADDAILEGATVRQAVGCPACRNTGYLGRLPIFEIMPVTEPISRLILDRAPRAQIEQLAVDEGMETMRTAAIRRVVTGVLSVEEMMRVIS
jgi:type IV pilus assembly protein PilB